MKQGREQKAPYQVKWFMTEGTLSFMIFNLFFRMPEVLFFASKFFFGENNQTLL